MKPATDSLNDKGVWYTIDHLKRMKEGGDTRLQEFIKKGYFNHGYTDAPSLKMRSAPAALTKFEPFTFDLVPGAEPAQALHELSTTGLSLLECATAVQVCKLQTLEEIIGTTRFNNHFRALCRNTSSTTIPFIDRNMLSLKKTIFECVSIEDPNHLKAGDLCHIGNVHYYHEKHPFGIGAGYNVIYEGAGKYIGFGLSKLNRVEIEKLLLQLYNEDPILPAEVIDYKEHYIPSKETLSLKEFKLTPNTELVKEFGYDLSPNMRFKLSSSVSKLNQAVIRPDMQKLRSFYKKAKR